MPFKNHTQTYAISHNVDSNIYFHTNQLYYLHTGSHIAQQFLWLTKPQGPLSAWDAASEQHTAELSCWDNLWAPSLWETSLSLWNILDNESLPGLSIFQPFWVRQHAVMVLSRRWKMARVCNAVLTETRCGILIGPPGCKQRFVKRWKNKFTGGCN